MDNTDSLVEINPDGSVTTISRERMDEAWCHAACLTIAETGQRWGQNIMPSLAMEAVFALRQERDRLQRMVDQIREAVTP